MQGVTGQNPINNKLDWVSLSKKKSVPLSCLSQVISLLVKQSSAQFLGQSRNLDISVFVPGPRCPVLFDIHHSCPASLMSFTFHYEPGEGSAVCSLNKLEYANNTVRTELPFNLLSAEHSPFQGDLFLCGCIKGFWSKAVGKVEESRFFFTFHPGIVPEPLCLDVLFCRQGLKRLRQAIYCSGLHLKVRSLNIDLGRRGMWELFSSSLPVSRTGMLVYLYFEKVRLLNSLAVCVCVCVHFWWPVPLCWCPAKAFVPLQFDVLYFLHRTWPSLCI